MKLPALLAGFALTAPTLAQWSTDTLSHARVQLAGTAVGDLAFFAGGVDTSSSSDIVDIFDASTRTWSTASLSEARYHVVATSAGGIALFAGGTPSGGESDRVDLYDTTTGTWSTASLSLARTGLAAASAGGQALFAGGFKGIGPVSRVDIFDTATGAWSTAELSEARNALAGTGVGDLVLFAGGGFSSTNHARVDIYDTTTGTWSVASLSQERHSLAATSVGGKALFGGGRTYGGNGSAHVLVDIYDSATGTWSTSALSEPRSNLVATTVGPFALFAGGRSNHWPTPSNVVDIFDSRTSTWSTATLSEERMFLAAAAAGDVALFAGGENLADDPSAVVDLFDLHLGTRYCSPATPNSTGLPAILFAEGVTDIAANQVVLTATQLPPGQFGYFLTGLTQGLIQPPGSQGPICLSGNIGRYNRAGEIIQGPAGSLQLDLTDIPVNPSIPAMPGDTWNFQCWYRDTHPTPTSNTTNGLAITFATTGAPAVQFAVTQASIVEEATQVEVRLTLSQSTHEDVILTWVAGGTATVDVDWRVEEANPFVIPAGRTHADMTLTIAEDGIQESNESAIVSLAAPIGAVLGTATTFTLTIVDDD